MFAVTSQGGDALRSTDEKLRVNPSSGTLFLVFPLPVTAARLGWQLSLNLVYDSSHGHGPFSVGWNIAIDSIQRKAAIKNW
ncbi:putative transporter PB1C11.03 [Fusarium oxysporum f. sp. albedinis]|nr:hypothetical protein HZ326_29076 [Fusarium oxysporum f. sp. albedinis]KAJ0130698.1 putative transporter PB1C11.03 [Fusarium oxysporum f. sp. albedinis]